MTATLHRFRLAAILALSVLVLLPGLARAETPDRELDAYLRLAIERYGVPGMSLAVLVDGKTSYVQTYGTASIEHQVPVNRDTRFPLATMTRFFNAAAVLELVEDRKLKLDDSIRVLLPALPAKWQAITVRHLLTRRSGLADYANPSFNGGRAPASADEAVLVAARAPLAFEPGTRAGISRTEDLLLAAVVEKASGRPFEGFMKSEIFERYQLTDAAYGGSRVLIPNRSEIYQALPPGPEGLTLERRSDLDLPRFEFATLGLNASSAEIADWMRLLLSGKILSKKTLKAAMTPETDGDRPQPFTPLFEYAATPRFEVFGANGAGLGDIRHFVPRDGKAKEVTIILQINGSHLPFQLPTLAQGIASIYDPQFGNPLEMIGDRLYVLMRSGQTKDALARYDAFRADPNFQTLSTELIINKVGYELLFKGMTAEALTLFELNTRDYPNSANVWDSLGEAKLASGDKDAAIANYQKSLQIDPTNMNAVRVLERLNAPIPLQAPTTPEKDKKE
ncbi:serine hydrolase [Gimibacter soli]|uniref:Serine hydrolase n=1 Tax=Gimibacter soli TaxID=3024400 RepID=A0AAF0BI73_9PROT|nr:serine hydrolase [Gimibacter soli]WCL55048.1 serine hydrolase [Gimibacter soli]